MLDLLTAGEAFDDFVFHGLARLPRAGEEIKTERFARSPGGGVLITAVAASRLGLRCAAMGGFGREAVRLLRDEGVRVRNLRRADEPAALSVALSTPRDRAFVTFTGMNGQLPGRLRTALAGVRARHVHFALCPDDCGRWERVVRALRAKGIGSSWDFGWNPHLVRDAGFWALATGVDYLFVNRDETVAYAGSRSMRSALDRWRRTPRCIVVKLGRAGSRVVGGGGEVRAKAAAANVVDTTGAGDAFNAGFLVARLRGLDLADALHTANRVAARSTERAGGIAGLPHSTRA